ncbi:MAG TPA: hypothetical protein VJY65_03855, partial [Chloroflexota bacterium]|nr:hypothetical protein [Chloroflexota bacterium]
STTTTVKPRIRILGPARYLVESTSRPGLGHQVDVLRLKCGCEAGKYGRRCRHLILALGYDEWRRRQQRAASATQWSAAVPAERGAARRTLHSTRQRGERA